MGHTGAAFSLQIRRERTQYGQGHEGDGAGDVRGGRLEDYLCERPRAHRRMVDSRTWNGAHGKRSENLGAESVSAVTRREKSVCSGRQRVCERQLPESDVDDYGAVLA